MSDAPQGADLSRSIRELESVAALGYLLNAIAHDLNNQLTNLLLGADQLQYGGGADAAEMMVSQANRVAEITRAVQKLGQGNFARSSESADLGDVARAFGAWRSATGRGEGDVFETEAGAMVRAHPVHLQRALALLADAFSEDIRSVRVRVGREDMPRTMWSRPDDTAPRGVLRLSVGEPAGDELASFKSVVDGFFDADRSDCDVRLMAAWEIVRKQRGRMTVHGAADSSDREVVLSFPLLEE